MKTIIAAVFAVVIGTLIFLICMTAHGQTIALNTDTQPVLNTDRAVILKGRIAGDWKSWLVIEAHNGQYWDKDGYDPSYTRVVCDYKPIFRHLPNGQWEIGFVSELTQKGAGIP